MVSFSCSGKGSLGFDGSYPLENKVWIFKALYSNLSLPLFFGSDWGVQVVG